MPDRSPALIVAFALVLALSAADAALTLRGVHGGLAGEANPLLRALLVRSPTLFVVVKLSLTAALLYPARKRPALVALALAAYLLVAASWASILLRR